MDTQIVEESFVEDINNILSSGEVSNLYKPDEFEEVSSSYCTVQQFIWTANVICPYLMCVFKS